MQYAPGKDGQAIRCRSEAARSACPYAATRPHEIFTSMLDSMFVPFF